MFGYVKPDEGDLLVRDLAFYRSTYCGVCRSMKHHTGFFSNVGLSYDSVFLALLRMVYLPDEEISARMGCCAAHPCKKKCMLVENGATVYTAKAFSILTYYKLLDDLHDEPFFRRVAARLARPVFRRAVRLAELPALSKKVSDKLREIRVLEEAREPSVDAPASLFGELLGEVFAEGLEGSARLVAYECGNRLGRFVYAADAAEDYERDRKRGSYNPFVVLYGGAPLTKANRESIRLALILECEKLERAVDLLPFGNKKTLEALIRNVIYRGLIKRIAFLEDPPKTEKRKS